MATQQEIESLGEVLRVLQPLTQEQRESVLERPERFCASIGWRIPERMIIGDAFRIAGLPVLSAEEWRERQTMQQLNALMFDRQAEQEWVRRWLRRVGLV